MQNGLYRKAGVSPAYFVSLFGKAFFSEQVYNRIDGLSKMGFSAMQLEIFERERLEDWQLGGLVRNLDEMAKRGMICPVFVAHFLGSAFINESNIKGGEFLSLLDEVLLMLDPLDKQVPLAVPFLPYEGDSSHEEVIRSALALLNEMAVRTGETGRDLIIEIVPGSLAQSYSHFIESPLWAPARGKVGFLLDTGHAHVTGENIPELIIRMGSDLKALHLSDNDGLVNHSYPPGMGNLDWRAVLSGLDQAGFTGTLDLEIVDEADKVDESYLQGLHYLASLM